MYEICFLIIEKHKIYKMESSDFNIFKLYKIYSH
nr:MAG TPA: hypothetical protein [Caudoviricetes sp.]DAJ40955.1 MAG TPA: hypothetical protein [Caudoviricetes sp.]DAR39524.1 MAG TPA: hypothetical protein [Caudoviricetes sp.]DAU98019.1 MAG TPA: hypothetical protein [Caudoviricetes sp.]